MMTCTKCPATLDKRNKTGLCAEHSAAWSKDDDNAMCDLMADGATYAAISDALGKGKNSVVSRWRKICRSMGCQAV